MLFTKEMKFEELVRDWEHTYGDIMSTRGFVGPPFILIFSFNKLKEIFLHQADFFSNRPDIMWLINQLSNKKGKDTLIGGYRMRRPRVPTNISLQKILVLAMWKCIKILPENYVTGS